jgi:hypothetical protein
VRIGISNEQFQLPHRFFLPVTAKQATAYSCRNLAPSALFAQRRSSLFHPLTPTARLNSYCIVPATGLGPSTAAVASSG